MRVGSGSSGYNIRGTRGSLDDGYRHVNGFTTRLHAGAQGKHIPGHRNYQKGKSIFRGSLADAQLLIERFAGSGTMAGPYKERVDFGKVIGTYVSKDGSVRLETTVGLICYSKLGAHIVPGKPVDLDDGRQ